MKIIIYGLGDGRREVEENLLHQHEIVAYTDEIDGIEIFNNKPYYHISKILKMKFDYIVLTGVHRKKV